MGQQQLLLLVLSLVIVGLAVVVGIQVWNEASRKDRADDLMNQNVRLAQEAIQWRGRDEIYGGGGGAGATFDPLASGGLTTMGVSASTLTTEHAIQSASGNVLEIVGVSTTFPNIGAYVRIQGDDIDSTSIQYDGSITIP
ncbi:MAG: hypothetical protein AAF791_03955 [Bacteroidota bacterium]